MYRSEADTDSVYSGATSDGCSLVSESMSFIAPSEYTNTISLTGNINHYLGYFIPGDNKSEFFFYVHVHVLYTHTYTHVHVQYIVGETFILFPVLVNEYFSKQKGIPQ